MLFLFRSFELVLQQDDALADQQALEDGTVPEKMPVLFLATGGEAQRASLWDLSECGHRIQPS